MPSGCSRRRRTGSCRRCRSICCRRRGAPSALRGASSTSPSACPSRPAPRSSPCPRRRAAARTPCAATPPGSRRGCRRSLDALEVRREREVVAVVLSLVLDQRRAREVVEVVERQRDHARSSASSSVRNSRVDTGSRAAFEMQEEADQHRKIGSETISIRGRFTDIGWLRWKSSLTLFRRAGTRGAASPPAIRRR